MSDDALFTPSRAYVSDRCGKWYAWHDFTQRTPRLYVTGECLTKLHGARVSLQRASVQGANPRILVLERVVVMERDSANSDRMEVRYEEATVNRFTQVLIQPDAMFIDVRVSS
jgi:hypothetical protein